MFSTRTLARHGAAVTVLALALAACAADPAEAPSADASATTASAADEILAAHDLAGLTAREVIDTLDATALEDRDAELMASIRPDELLLTDADGTEASLPMPDDAFYVSLAPYVDSTHECYFHSLTTCTGEMQAEDIDVTVTDVATGEVLVDEEMTTFANGFVGLWLPRDAEVDVTITQDGLTATERLTTDDADDATCVTTMQLA
ncbi:CueP family metal-binding protein [Demequina sp. NBRC 110057]|uniref:CueP family metal-binding protein n=1 Tax=Demequina sp. NBRC 110057 TaxID=1570346 RepID=UPI000A04D06D|nr:CueP family metal-binding protein [Demequina sp. NBRC 110057]